MAMLQYRTIFRTFLRVLERVRILMRAGLGFTKDTKGHDDLFTAGDAESEHSGERKLAVGM